MADKKKSQKIKIAKDGPYIVQGNMPLAEEILVSDQKETPLRWERGEPFPEREAYALCRCGQSKNKPFCDGTHLFSGLRAGNETIRK